MPAPITRVTYSNDLVHFDYDANFSCTEKSLISYLNG